jgi:hypothetical protein
MKKYHRALFLLPLLVLSLIGGCQDSDQPGTLTVTINVPGFAALNAGANAVDGLGTNRAVSDVMVLDSNGQASIALHMDGDDVIFDSGTVLTVYCNIWVGLQTDNEYRFTATKQVTISGDTTVTFNAADNTLLPGKLTVNINVPAQAGNNAGSNAVDRNSVNRAVSDVMVLDVNGQASVVLHMNSQDVIFDGGTNQTVYCTIWIGQQTDGNTTFTASKQVTVLGDTTVTFTADDNALP